MHIDRDISVHYRSKFQPEIWLVQIGHTALPSEILTKCEVVGVFSVMVKAVPGSSRTKLWFLVRYFYKKMVDLAVQSVLVYRQYYLNLHISVKFQRKCTLRITEIHQKLFSLLQNRKLR